MPQVAHDQLETAPDGRENALFADDDAFLRKTEEEFEDICDDEERDCHVDAREFERRVDVPKNQRARGDECGKAAEHQELMDREDREEVIQRQNQAAAHPFFPVRFCSQADDCAQAEVWHEEFDHNEGNECRNDDQKHPERHALVEVDFDVEESHIAAPAEIFVCKIDLIDQELQIEQSFEKRGRERPAPNGHFSRCDRPCFCDDFTGSHSGTLYWK